MNNNSFKLNWNFKDKNALLKAIRAITIWIRKQNGTSKNLRIKDMILAINPKMYNNFSRGDKCRIGRAISILYNNGAFPGLQRGNKNGATNTYHVI